MSEVRMIDVKNQRLLARLEILDVLARYVRGCDRGDGDILASCYHIDAVEEHAGNFVGNAHDYIYEAIPRILKMGAMQHLLGSSHIEFKGDMAWVETNVWTFLRIKVNGGFTDTLTGGRIFDLFELREGDWKIAHRKTIFDWNRDAPMAEGWVNGLIDFSNQGALMGCKGEEDPSYRGFSSI
ncbi:MAG TPA: nuclear transport factor 2 family protein [Porticoccaceae bacterium]|nr:nuclear transport factor 2 family protein [Porticoccaceae bacterium]